MITIPEIQDIIMSNNPHSYYHIYKQYEQSYWKHIPNWILEHCRNNNIKNCIDLGIAYGTLGLYTKLFTNCNVYGIDFVKYISDDLVNKYNINYQLKNIELEEFNYDTKFEIVLFTEVFEHLNFNPIKTMQKINSILSDNGKVFFSTPDSASKWGKINIYQTYKEMPEPNSNIEIKDAHIYQYNIDELKKIFNLSGFKIDKLDYSESGKNLRHFNIQLSKR